LRGKNTGPIIESPLMFTKRLELRGPGVGRKGGVTKRGKRVIYIAISQRTGDQKG